MRKRDWILVAAAAGAGYTLWGKQEYHDYVNGLAFQAPDAYWKNYLPLADAEEVERIVRETYLRSVANVPIHVDLYRQDTPSPTLVFVHGIGFYARPYARYLLALYRRGYNIVAPDLAGMGWSGGERGGMTMGEQVRVIRDTITYALEQFGPPVYLTGISLGGILTLATAAADDRLAGIMPFNITDLSELGQMSRVSRLRWAVPILAGTFVGLGRLAPSVKVPYQIVLDSKAIFDDPQALALYNHDPLAVRAYSLRFINSMLTTPLSRPLSAITTPALVLQPEQDGLVPADVAQANFNHLAGPKEFILFPGAKHYSLRAEFLDEVASVVDRWVREQAVAKTVGQVA